MSFYRFFIKLGNNDGTYEINSGTMSANDDFSLEDLKNMDWGGKKVLEAHLHKLENSGDN